MSDIPDIEKYLMPEEIEFLKKYNNPEEHICYQNRMLIVVDGEKCPYCEKIISLFKCYKCGKRYTSEELQKLPIWKEKHDRRQNTRKT